MCFHVSVMERNQESRLDLSGVIPKMCSWSQGITKATLVSDDSDTNLSTTYIIVLLTHYYNSWLPHDNTFSKIVFVAVKNSV